MSIDALMSRLERSGVPVRTFWEDGLEMALDPVLQPVVEGNGFLDEWLRRRTGRQVSMLGRILGTNGDGSVQRRKAVLGGQGEATLPYVLVEHFGRYKSRVAVVEFAKGKLAADVVASCRKDEDGEDYDTAALLFALYEQDPENLRLVFHLDKIHKSGFARMRLKKDRRKPSRPLKDAMRERDVAKVLESFDKAKHDGRRSELKAIVPNATRVLVFIRRAARQEYILSGDGIVHGYRPEWIILDFEEHAKRVSISSISVSVPLEIANRIATAYHGEACEYDNESEITYAKQIEKFLKHLAGEKTGELLLVELVAASSPLDGAPKLKISDEDSKPIGPALAHFARGIENLLDDVARLESVKVLYKKKRVSLLFDREDLGDDALVVRYSDARLNGFERKQFEDLMGDTHGIPVLSTEKRFAR